MILHVIWCILLLAISCSSYICLKRFPPSVNGLDCRFSRVQSNGCNKHVVSTWKTITYSINQAHSDELWTSRDEKVKKLRKLLEGPELVVMPCVYDGLSARMVERAGFNLTFMTGFGVSGVNGLPDTGLISVQEMTYAATIISRSLRHIPCIGDGDTGYGNVANVRRTIEMYTQAGMAGIMIEDQLQPKRCGHTKGKQVVDRDEAYRRIRAAVEARERSGQDIVILARTDARGTIGFDEAIERCKMFRKLGADWTFLEAPESEEEMIRYCKEVDGPKLANMLEFGKTPVLSPLRLQEIGFKVAAYPLTLLSASAKAIDEVLSRLRNGQSTESELLSFQELQSVVGFQDYYNELDRFK